MSASGKSDRAKAKTTAKAKAKAKAKASGTRSVRALQRASRYSGSSASKEVICQLCPRDCKIPPGYAGDCRVRVNVDGKLLATTYGRPCSVRVDPIEKKPLFHLLPGSRILSLATVGCNLHCKNCQNHEISQANPWDRKIRVRSVRRGGLGVTPDEMVAVARRRNCPSIAATYTEPIIYYEYTRDIAERARAAGIKMVTVTAGYANAGPLRRLSRLIDASNVDLKTMSPARFRDNCGGELKYVLRGLVIAKEEGVFVEVTNLIIPTFNDSAKETRQLCRWVKQNLGAATPVHFSRFHPKWRLRNLPPTPAGTLRRAYDIAKEEGLYYPYVGNLPGNDGEHTFCPECHEAVIRRVGYRIRGTNLKNGQCGSCQRPIEGAWK